MIRTARLTRPGKSQLFAASGRSSDGRLRPEVEPDCYPLSRHAIMYRRDLRASSAAVLEMPMSANIRSSSPRSSLYRDRRSHLRAIPASDASGIFHDHPRSGKMGEIAPRVLVELQVVLPQGMFHLHRGAKQRLASGAHRAVVNGPSDIRITACSGAQAIASEHEPDNRHAACRPHAFTIGDQLWYPPAVAVAPARAPRECSSWSFVFS